MRAPHRPRCEVRGAVWVAHRWGDLPVAVKAAWIRLRGIVRPAGPTTDRERAETRRAAAMFGCLRLALGWQPGDEGEDPDATGPTMAPGDSLFEPEGPEA